MDALKAIANGLDRVNDTVGRGVAWLALTLVLVQFLVVVLRYVFNEGSIALQESILYLHGLLFILGAGYTLLKNGHVRVDVFYRESSTRRKAWVDLLGTIFFLLPFCIIVFDLAFSYVVNAWITLEGSVEVEGLPLVFLLKTTIWLFAFLLALQALSILSRSLLILIYNEDTRPHAEHLEEV